MRLRRLIVPALVVLPVLAMLLGLGTWQLQRLAWKTELLARIAASEAGPAQPLAPGAEPEPYQKLALTGRFDHGREALLGLEVRGQVLGARLVTPLLRPGGADAVLVDRGWVPLDRPEAPIARPEGEVVVEGYARPSESPSMFSATDDPAARRFFTFDTAAIGAALGLPRTAPFALVALGAQEGLPQPARTLPRPANSHLGYVITWYGLALSLVGVFAAWSWRRLKEPA
jgi:surfeit locus 1 family protein